MKFLVGDRCNVTLGGVRSIQVSYEGIAYILLNFKRYVKEKRSFLNIREGKLNFPLYRSRGFGYNKPNYVNLTK